MAGFVHYYFTIQAKQYISPMLVNVCYNFTPFLSQVTAYLLQAQAGFPGYLTAYGGAALFIGCTLLAMNYLDQKELQHVPLVGDSEAVPAIGEPQGESVLKPPIELGYMKFEEGKK